MPGCAWTSTTQIHVSILKRYRDHATSHPISNFVFFKLRLTRSRVKDICLIFHEKYLICTYYVIFACKCRVPGKSQLKKTTSSVGGVTRYCSKLYIQIIYTNDSIWWSSYYYIVDSILKKKLIYIRPLFFFSKLKINLTESCKFLTKFKHFLQSFNKNDKTLLLN